MTKMYRRPEGDIVVRHSHGIYMVVDLVNGMNCGWVSGNAKEFKFIAEVPDGVAGGAHAPLRAHNLEIMREACS